MRFRYIGNYSALFLSALFLAFIAIQARPAFSQEITPDSSNSQVPANRTTQPQDLQKLPANHAFARPHARRATSAIPTPEASASTPNFGGFYAAPYYTIVTDTGFVSEDATITADFNKDGKPDIASISFDGSITLLLNDGKGGFLTPVVSPVGEIQAVGAIPLAFAVDLNGDGYPDIAIGAGTLNNQNNSTYVAVSLNQKNGTFGPLTLLPIPNANPGSTVIYRSFTTGINPVTKHEDIIGVTGNPVSNAFQIQLTRFTNNGSGSFTAQPAQIIIPPTAASPNVRAYLSIASADVNGDGIPDLILRRDLDVVGTGTYIDILLGNSDGTFQQPKNPSVFFPGALLDSNVTPQDIVHLESLTGDPNKLDLIVNMGYSVFVALANGDGTFQSPKSAQPFGSTQLLFADLNGDGKLDMVTTGAGSLIAYPGNGDGTFGSPAGGTAINSGGVFDSVLRTVLADFDGDGKLDLANGDESGHVEVARGNGDGTFQATPLLLSVKDPVLTPADISVIGSADINGDGLPDLLANSSYGTANGLITALAKPSGGFTYITNALTYPDLPSGFYHPYFADLNGDGKQDVLFFNYKGSVAVALSNGDGTFKTPLSLFTITPTIACPYNVNATTADVNGDGKMDFLIVYQGDASCGASSLLPPGVFTALGNGDGTLQSMVFTAVGADVYEIVAAKFHGKDKPLDIVLADVIDNNNSYSYKEYLLTANSDGSFSNQVTVATYRITQILVDDFNQDGVPDLTLIVQDLNADGALLYAGKGDGTFDAPTTIGAEQIDSNGLYADLNGDGIPDLVGDGGSGLLGVYLGTGKGSFAPPSLYYAPNEGQLFAGSFLGDNTNSLVAFAGGGTAFFMNQGGTSLTLTPSATSVNTATAISLTAKLTATLSDQPEPTGTVTYYDGTTKLGSEPVGTELTAVKLAAGTHKLTSAYSGDTHFNPNVSTAVNVTVTALPTFTLSPASLAFGSVNVGSTSATQVLTIKNNTSAAVPLTAITVSAPFIKTASNCGATVPNGGACTVTIAYRPTAVGASSGTVVVTSTAPGSPFSAALTGTGTSAAALTLSPTSLAFGSVNVGSTSATQVLTIKNNTSAAVPIGAITVPAPFIKTASNCGATVPNGAACTVTIAYKPTTVGASNATFVVTSTGAGSPFSATLTGTSVVALTLSPTPLAFGSVKVGSTSTTQVLTIKNNTSAAVPIGAITVPAPFIKTASNCGATVPNGGACTVTIAYRPTAIGASNGTLVVTSTVAGSPFSATLTGTGTSAVALTLSPTSLAFGSVKVGSTSATQVLTIKNNTSAAVPISAIAVPAPFIKTASNCGATVPNGGACTVTIAYRPTAVGASNGTVVVTSTAAGSPFSAALTGTGN